MGKAREVEMERMRETWITCDVVLNGGGCMICVYIYTPTHTGGGEGGSVLHAGEGGEGSA